MIDECDPDSFQCAHGLTCIHKHYECDGDNDCGDESDEQNCLTRSKYTWETISFSVLEVCIA